jgi:hypothetical protein
MPAADEALNEETLLALTSVGAHQLRVISSNILELTLVTTKPPDPARVTQWDFVRESERLRLPAAREFAVSIGDRKVSVQTVGFKRRVLYAPLARRDLRIGNYLYLRLAEPIAEGQTVEVRNPSGMLWQAPARFRATADPLRFSPVIHVNQVGYTAALPKKAMVGYFLGSLASWSWPLKAELISWKRGQASAFISANSGVGQMWVMNTRRCRTKRPRSRLQSIPDARRIPAAGFGLGASFPFTSTMGWPRFLPAYALGLYHQRCGTSNALPLRFVHGPCHTAPAECQHRG